MTERADTNTPATRLCDNATEVLLLALLGWLPLAFGGVLPLSHGLIVAGAALAGLLLGIKCTVGRQTFRWSPIYIPLFGFVGLVNLQGQPLPFDWLSTLAHAAGEQWHAMLSTPALADGFPRLLPISLYPQGTQQDLALLTAGMILLVALTNLYHSGRRTARLLGWIAAIGGSVALLGLLQTLLGAKAIYWTVPVGHLATAGSFVHYGHFAQFLNLSIGCALALLLMRLAQRTGRLQHNAQEMLADLRQPGRMVDWLLLLMIVLSMLAIAVSRSRNGLLSMCIGGIVVAIVLHRTRILRGTGWLLATMVIGALISLLFLGFDPVYERMATLEDPANAFEGRGWLIRDSMSAFATHPVLGIGQGAFEYVFPMFDTSFRGGRAQHAENFYVELLVETGIVGAGLMIALGLLVGRAWWQRLRQQSRDADIALAGLLFGVTAVLFHASTDFGLRIPAVAALVTVIVALVSARASRPMLINSGKDNAVRPSRRGIAMAAMIGIGGGTLLALQIPPIIAAYHADHHWRAAKALRADTAEATDERQQELYEQQREHVAAAVKLMPGHAEYRLRHAWLRWEQPLMKLTSYQADPSELSDTEIAELQTAAEVAQQLALEARRIAPTYGLPWTLAGQLGVQWLDQPEAGDWIIRGMQLSPESPEACLAAARQLLEQGDDAAATAAFHRATKVGTSSARVLEALVEDAARPDLAADLADGDVRRLVVLLGMIHKKDELQTLATSVRQQATALLSEAVDGESPTPWALQQLATMRAAAGQDAEAIQLYRRFLAALPNHAVRFQLALALERQGQIEAAITELRRLLIYRRNYGPAKQRLRQLEGR